MGERSTHQAMLFERCRSVHTIGMTFPISVAFLDASWRVTRVARTPTGRIVFVAVRDTVPSAPSEPTSGSGTCSAGRQLSMDQPLAMLAAAPVGGERDQQDPIPLGARRAEPSFAVAFDVPARDAGVARPPRGSR